MWKTAFPKQETEILRKYEYAIIHVNPVAEPLQERLSITGELKDLLRELPGEVRTAIRLVDVAVELLYKAVRIGLKEELPTSR